MIVYNRLSWVIFLAILLYPLLSMLQGVDVTDTGFSVAHYALFLDHFDAISASSSLWLTTLLGALWENTVGVHFGLIAHRFLFVLLTYINALLAYLLLRRHFRSEFIFIGIFLAIAYQSMSHVTYDYNLATSTFYLLALYSLYNGLTENNKFYIFIAGIIIGSNIFVRIPNIIGIGLYLLILIHSTYKTPFNIKDFFYKSIVFFAGVLTGVIIILALMHQLGHLDHFISICKSLIDVLLHGGGKDTHSGASLLSRYIGDFKDAAEKTVFTSVYIGIFVIFISYTERENRTWLSYLLSFLFLSYGFYVLVTKTHEVIYYLFGLLLSTLLILLYNTSKRGNTALFHLTLFSIIYLCIGFIGSNTGIYNAKYTLSLPAGLAVGYVLSTSHAFQKHIAGFSFNLSEKYERMIKYSIISSLITAAMLYSFMYPYRDAPKSSLVHPIEHSRLGGIYTTAARAQSLQQVITQIELYSKKGDTILCYDSIPLLYYVTGTIPYLPRTWMETLPPRDVQEAFLKQEKSSIPKPLVVRAKYDTNNGAWPETKFILPLDEWAQNRKIGDDFLSRNQYKKIWENDFFALYLPKENNDRK